MQYTSYNFFFTHRICSPFVSSQLTTFPNDATHLCEGGDDCKDIRHMRQMSEDTQRRERANMLRVIVALLLVVRSCSDVRKDYNLNTSTSNSSIRSYFWHPFLLRRSPPVHRIRRSLHARIPLYAQCMFFQTVQFARPPGNPPARYVRSSPPPLPLPRIFSKV